MVEQCAVNALVAGSSPALGATQKQIQNPARNCGVLNLSHGTACLC